MCIIKKINVIVKYSNIFNGAVNSIREMLIEEKEKGNIKHFQVFVNYEAKEATFIVDDETFRIHQTFTIEKLTPGI